MRQSRIRKNLTSGLHNFFELLTKFRKFCEASIFLWDNEHIRRSHQPGEMFLKYSYVEHLSTFFR